VTLLEKGIGERRPKYADYIRRINAFRPRIPEVIGSRGGGAIREF
jgi:steroid 5-alpha reductase family enzyme